MLDQTPDDFFANASEHVTYLATPVELWIGKFELNLKGSSGCFIPHATAWLWNQYGKYMKAYDALAVYTGGDESRLTRAIDLFRNPPLSVNGDFQSYWLSQMTELFPLVLINGHDGYHIDCYACDQQAFKLMDDSIAYATDFISGLPWYQQHKEELVWSDYWSCLTFPQYKDGP